jgi:cytochrome c oxidase subunit 2
MRHFIIVALLVIVVSVLVYFGLDVIGLMPVEASAQAAEIDHLFNLEVIVISFLFALITVPLAYSLIVFRRKDGDDTDAEHMEGNTKLEIAWTVIPLFIVLAFAYMGAQNLGETRRVDPQALEVKVTAFQWGWIFDYPSYGITGSNELYLPVNKQVLFRMNSRDVIHSFFVPEFRMKQDLVPGQTTELRVTPIRTGDYKVRCAELCGKNHALMLAPVHVVAQDSFDNWIKKKQMEAAQAAASGPSAEQGQAIYQQYCKACHSLDGSKGTGPTWRGLFGSTVELADGTTVTADENYIHQSIQDPNSQIVAGFNPNVMPNFGLSDNDISSVIEFIKTLK